MEHDIPSLGVSAARIPEPHREFGYSSQGIEPQARLHYRGHVMECCAIEENTDGVRRHLRSRKTIAKHESKRRPHAATGPPGKATYEKYITPTALATISPDRFR
jgi:hypothetical protein